MKNESVLITKATGELAPFNPEKLMQSLKRAGAPDETARNITAEVSSKIYAGMSTKKIYSMAFSLLKNQSRPVAARYHLKTAIMELGPSGFPFEKYFAAILEEQGYAVRVGEIVNGKCVTHEIDVIAEKGNDFFMVECKYHNNRGIICDVKIPLYIHARFNDVEAVWLTQPEYQTKNRKGWVVTNTKFSADAIQYATCAGLKLVGWNYPFKESLKETIDTLGLYPITCLTTLTRKEKTFLLENKIVLCKEISDDPHWLLEAGITEARAKTIMAESTLLCKKLTDSKNGKTK
jgi:hypothetical protein